MTPVVSSIVATLLVSLRIGPALAFAPPFTLLRIPAIVRVFLALGLAAWIVTALPALTTDRVAELGFVQTLIGELLLGAALALGLQIAFAAILVAGRTIDIQAGFGLALLADPTLRSQMPLIGTLFAYGAAAVFFALGGANDLLFIWQESVQRVPLGRFSGLVDIDVLLTYISTVFVMALGLAGLVLLTLFLIDLSVAFISRTLPQMNVLLLGFQVKTLAILIVLPLVFTVSGTLFFRLVRMALEAGPQLL